MIIIWEFMLLLYVQDNQLIFDTSDHERADSACTSLSSHSSFMEETIQWKKGNVLGKGAFGTVCIVCFRTDHKCRTVRRLTIYRYILYFYIIFLWWVFKYNLVYGEVWSRLQWLYNAATSLYLNVYLRYKKFNCIQLFFNTFC